MPDCTVCFASLFCHFSFYQAVLLLLYLCCKLRWNGSPLLWLPLFCVSPRRSSCHYHFFLFLSYFFVFYSLGRYWFLFILSGKLALCFFPFSTYKFCFPFFFTLMFSASVKTLASILRHLCYIKQTFKVSFDSVSSCHALFLLVWNTIVFLLPTIRIKYGTCLVCYKLLMLFLDCKFAWTIVWLFGRVITLCAGTNIIYLQMTCIFLHFINSRPKL